MFLSRLFHSLAIASIVAAPALAHDGELRLVLNLKGADRAYDGRVPVLPTTVAHFADNGAPLALDAEGMLPVKCFDVGLLDPNTGRSVGSATDCLGNITPVNGVDDAAGLQVIGTTFFRLHGGRTVVSQGLTNVQRVTHTDQEPITHTTGAFPSGGNDIVNDLSSRGFRRATGSARLSGAVDMDGLPGGRPGFLSDPNGWVDFDCLFVLVIRP